MTGILTTSITGLNLRSPNYNSVKSTTFHKPSINAVITAIKPKSLYDVLRIEKTATVSEIKTAYRSLAKIYHPDALDLKQQDDVGRDFVEIHDAYATLSDPVARELYDMKFRLRLTGEVPEKVFCTCRRWETDQCW